VHTAVVSCRSVLSPVGWSGFPPTAATAAMMHTSTHASSAARDPTEIPFPVGPTTLAVMVPTYVLDPAAFDAAVASKVR
jgi:hypothetical protein